MTGWLVAAALLLAGTVLGALWGWRCRQQTKEERPLPPCQAELPRGAVRQKRELGNFLHYDGEQMPDPEQPGNDAYE